MYWLKKTTTRTTATPTLGCNYTRNCKDVSFKRVTDLNREKLGTYKPGQHQPSEEDFKPGSFVSQLHLNCQKINCLHEFGQFYYLMNRCIFQYKSMNISRWIDERNIKSPVSTDWSIQSISIKSHLPIFIGWLLQVDRSCAGPKTISDSTSVHTYKNGDFGPISVTARSCAAPNLKKDRHISEQFLSYFLVLCEHVCILYQIAFLG